MKSLLIPFSDFDALSIVERKKSAQKLRIIKHLSINGSASNQELCLALAMSSPTANILLNELLADNLVEKCGRGKSIGGRKPDLYRLCDKAFFVLSIHMEKFRTRMVIVDGNSKPVAPVQTFPIQLSKDMKAVVPLIEHASDLMKNSGVEDKIIGIGISMPGLVSLQEGESHTYLMVGTSETPLQQLLEGKLGKPVFIQNDAKSAALAEQHYGLAKDKRDALVLSIDWGVGLGIILDGKLHDGSSGFAGEFGHIPIEDNGQLCHCGKRGCLETVASGLALVRMAKEGMHAGQYSMLKMMLGEDNMEEIKPHHVIEAANKGDQFAINLLSTVGVNLGKGLSILIQVFNPEVIIIGGKIAAAGQYITIPVLHAINTYCMAQLREKTTIALSTLDDEAGLQGAVATILENIFEKYIT